MKRVLYLASLLLIQALPSLAQPPAGLVVDGNRSWAQPADFVNVSWDTMNALCPGTQRVCTGMVNGIDITGFIFASQADVQGMLSSLFGVPPFDVEEDDSDWAPAVLAAFDPTNTLVDRTSLSASDTDLNQDVPPRNTWIRVQDEFVSPPGDEAETLRVGTNVTSGTRGIWLYREQPTAAATSIPTMGTYGLIITVLGLLVVAGRRLSSTTVPER